jgi:N-acetylglucosaminyldiphosphoundecaprenol N-acetyl-beta-D-mannosaminyltransferase
MAQAIEKIDLAISSRNPGQKFGFVNAHSLTVAWHDRVFSDALNSMDGVFGDGTGVRVASKVAETPIADNVNGTDLFPHLCALCVRKKYSLFLFGARPGVAHRMREQLKCTYPNLRIVGCRHGYIDGEGENFDVIDEVNRSGADVLLVARGVPQQEKWIRENASKLERAVSMGVGGLFDFYSGDIPRAPVWMRRRGMEWIYRFIRDPIRLWKRYTLGNALFLWRVFNVRWNRISPIEIAAEQNPDTLDIFGVPIKNVTMKEALSCIEQAIDATRQIKVYFVNTFYLNTAWEDFDYRQALQKGDFVFGDGTGVRMASRMLRKPIVDNVNGTDMLPQLCEVCQRRRFRLFLLGAMPGVAAKTKEWIETHYPGVEVVGLHHGHFSWETDDEFVVKAVNTSNCDILLVGFSAPRQELWIQSHAKRLKCSVLMGVGGLFDVYGGNLHRPPTWLRRCGLEWVGRLCQEPRRLWKRYLIGNPLFILRVLRWRSQSRSRKSLNA